MKKIYSLIILLLTIGFVFSIASVSLAIEDKNYGLKTTATEAGIPMSGTVQGTIGTVLGIVLSFVGVLFLILMIYGGIIWMIARGNEQEVTKAKNIIIAAIVGIIIVASAYAITALVFGIITKPTV